MKKKESETIIHQIEEKIKDYKISLTETDDEAVKMQLEIVIDDLETILYE